MAPSSTLSLTPGRSSRSAAAISSAGMARQVGVRHLLQQRAVRSGWDSARFGLRGGWSRPVLGLEIVRGAWAAHEAPVGPDERGMPGTIRPFP